MAIDGEATHRKHQLLHFPPIPASAYGCLNVPATGDRDTLEFAKDMWDADEPGLWERDLTGHIEPLDRSRPTRRKRLLRAASRVGQVGVYSFSASTPIWWKAIGTKLSRTRNLSVWQVPTNQSQALAVLAQRTIELQGTVQDGAIWVGDGTRSIEVAPRRLCRPGAT